MPNPSLENVTKIAGASSLEYLILVASIISVLIACWGPEGVMTNAIKSTQHRVADVMVNMVSSEFSTFGSSETTSNTGTTLDSDTVVMGLGGLLASPKDTTPITGTGAK